MILLDNSETLGKLIELDVYAYIPLGPFKIFYALIAYVIIHLT
jgi:hypothetical protein